MKRLGHVWDQVIDIDNGLVAVMDGTRKKRGKKACQKFLFSPEEVIESPCLYRAIDPKRARTYVKQEIIPILENQTWKPDKPRFIRRWCPNRTSKGGKWRNLYVPSMRDHIIHHMIMKVAMPAFTRGMHPHYCGSVPGRGIKHIIRCGRRWFIRDKKCKYFVKLDIRHFFDSIDRDILMSKLKKKIKDKYLLWAFETIIYSSPVPCPVGYYPSPWLANLYLEDFDHFVEQGLYKERRGKRIKYVRHYLRYSDDILLTGTSYSDMKKAIHAIISYLWSNLRLRIKPAWEIKRIGRHETVNGKRKLIKGTYYCDLGGYKFCKDAVISRDGIFLSARRLAKKMSRQDHYTVRQCQSINARVAWLSHANSFTLIEYQIKPYINLKQTRSVISYVDRKRVRGFQTARVGTVS